MKDLFDLGAQFGAQMLGSGPRYSLRGPELGSGTRAWFRAQVLGSGPRCLAHWAGPPRKFRPKFWLLGAQAKLLGIFRRLYYAKSVIYGKKMRKIEILG